MKWRNPTYCGPLARLLRDAPVCLQRHPEANAVSLPLSWKEAIGGAFQLWRASCVLPGELNTAYASFPSTPTWGFHFRRSASYRMLTNIVPEFHSVQTGTATMGSDSPLTVKQLSATGLSGANRRAYMVGDPPLSNMPRPLHITKQPVVGSGSRITQRPRYYSPESAVSDATSNSPPEPAGADRPLTVPKRRGGRAALAECTSHWARITMPTDGGNPCVPSRFGIWVQRSLPWAAGSSTPRPRPASCASPHQPNHRALNGPDSLFPTRLPIRDGGFDDASARKGARNPRLSATPQPVPKQHSPLRSAMSMLGLPPSYDDEDAARTLHTAVPAGVETPTLSPREPCLPEPWVLAPRIVVTPEFSALDEGADTLWAAVQLSAHAYQANAFEQRHDTAWVYATGRSCEPQPSGEDGRTVQPNQDGV